jgi:putative transcriptional regulator
MKKERFDQLVASLEEVKEHVATGRFRGRINRLDVRPIDVRTIRKRSGMTQQRFAETFGIGLGTLQKWERGERRPSGAARSLLLVMQADLQVVVNALTGLPSQRNRRPRRVGAAA